MVNIGEVAVDGGRRHPDLTGDLSCRDGIHAAGLDLAGGCDEHLVLEVPMVVGRSRHASMLTLITSACHYVFSVHIMTATAPQATRRTSCLVSP